MKNNNSCIFFFFYAFDFVYLICKFYYRGDEEVKTCNKRGGKVWEEGEIILTSMKRVMEVT